MNRMVWKKFVFGVVVGMLTIAVASPALAAETGSGTVTGGTWSDETLQSSSVACGGKVTSSSHSWNETGTFTASNGGVTFSGSSSVTLSSSEDYWFDQQGSYRYGGCASNPNNGGAAGYSVPATISVSGGSGSNTISCSSMSGSFRRTNIVDVDVTATGTCTVNGTSVSTTITWDLVVPVDPVTFEPFIESGSYDQN